VPTSVEPYHLFRILPRVRESDAVLQAAIALRSSRTEYDEMSVSRHSLPQFGRVGKAALFDEIADQYAAARPAYPDELISGLIRVGPIA
jgi:hypothetical protein